MNFIAPDLVPAVPEIALLILISLVLVVDVYVPERYRVFSYQLAQASLVLTAILVIGLVPDTPQLTFSDTFVLDRMAPTSSQSRRLGCCIEFGFGFFVFLTQQICSEKLVLLF